MTLRTMIAVALIVLGLTVLTYAGITYRSPGKSIDVGPLHVTTEKTRHIPMPPIAGAVAFLAGIALLVADRKSLMRTAA